MGAQIDKPSNQGDLVKPLCMKVKMRGCPTLLILFERHGAGEVSEDDVWVHDISIDLSKCMCIGPTRVRMEPIFASEEGASCCTPTRNSNGMSVPNVEATHPNLRRPPTYKRISARDEFRRAARFPTTVSKEDIYRNDSMAAKVTERLNLLDSTHKAECQAHERKIKTMMVSVYVSCRLV